MDGLLHVVNCCPIQVCRYITREIIKYSQFPAETDQSQQPKLHSTSIMRAHTHTPSEILDFVEMTNQNRNRAEQWLGILFEEQQSH